MAATSLKLPGELKERIRALVKEGDRSAHAFMVEAIDRAARAEELRRRFGADAADAEQDVQGSGKAYEAREAFEYFEARLSGGKVRRPKPKSWRKSG